MAAVRYKCPETRHTGALGNYKVFIGSNFKLSLVVGEIRLWEW